MAAVGFVRIREVLERLVALGLGLGRRSVCLVEGVLCCRSVVRVVGVLDVEADEDEVPLVRQSLLNLQLGPDHLDLAPAAHCDRQLLWY